MALSRRTPSRSRSRLTLVLLVLTSVTLLTLDYRGFEPLEQARSTVLDVFAPVGDAAESAFEPVSDAWNGATGYDELRDENEELRQRLVELEGQLADGEAARRELTQLQEQLDPPFVGQIPTARATVVSGAVTNFDDTITIDKGTGDGVRDGMAVVAGSGLIGRVADAGDNRSSIQLVSDPSFQLGVRVSGQPGLGIVQGQGDERRLRATSFDIDTPLDDGDLLVTSGAEKSTLPPDVPVGRVTDVVEDDVLLQKEAEVELLANLNDLRYVTVLLWESPA